MRVANCASLITSGDWRSIKSLSFLLFLHEFNLPIVCIDSLKFSFANSNLNSRRAWVLLS